MNERLSGITVLLVDDEAPLVRVVSMALEAEGATVHAAATLDEAFACIERERIDIAVLDLHLREARTDALAEALQARALPYVSSTGSTDVLPPVFAEGLCLQVRKPFDVDDLVRSLALLHAAARRASAHRDMPGDGG